ncbi:uncharacterized protein LOC106150933 [Lingula anatina]|uniref:Uncharacterized protein LOC106150933 n=1 Tax=Lingula anatina TaxID=7574 RepID=A0A1S3GZW3_LINAN|nr:uncharacterized protein LOC106150933 [Lingula anatina]|eukprot:XP_013379415.1 uncharacterized protein LOC106150933 [Lingula anatina]
MDFTHGPDEKDDDEEEKDRKGEIGDCNNNEEKKAGEPQDESTGDCSEGSKALQRLAPCWPPKCYIIDPVTLKICERGLTKTLCSPVARNQLKGNSKSAKNRKTLYPKKTVHFLDEKTDSAQADFSIFPILPPLTPSEQNIHVPMGPDLSWLPVPIGEHAEKEATDKYNWFWRHQLHPAPCIIDKNGKWWRSNIPQKLGVCFKTDAHKKYHMLHPEAVPDLRDSMVYHKKYFFHGYHSTAFRG